MALHHSFYAIFIWFAYDLADIQTRNIHLRIQDDSILKTFEENDLANPSPRKAIGDDFIIESRGLRIDRDPGRPVLCDFGEARYGQATYTDEIQPWAYRAPEVMLKIPWSFSADIWNVGVLVGSRFRGMTKLG